MSEFVSVIFCRRCGSRYVELNEWTNEGAIVSCRTCNNKSILKGFTLGRCTVSKKELDIARNTSAGINDFEK
jgi:DNA-directed RNA polymerase subunit RPC12/RpoP